MVFRFLFKKLDQKIYNTIINNIQIDSSQLVIENIIRNIKNKKKGIQDEQFFRLAIKK